MSPRAWSPYCGPGATPLDVAGRWNADPVLLTVLAGLALVVWRGRAGPAGWWALAVAALLFVSPLCALSSALFSVRTVHHVVLIAVLAPLTAWAMPARRFRGLGTATVACTAVFWAWHAPAAYGMAMSSHAAYWMMQATLGISAVWFWMALRSAAPLAAISSLLLSTVQMGLLGALLTVANRAVYAPHALTTYGWGVTPLEDQQIAGLIMWAPAAALYLGWACVLLERRLRTDGASA